MAERPIHFAKDAPLRPELIESAFYLFRVTQDHTFLHHAKRILRALNDNSRVECGYASIADVTTKRCAANCACFACGRCGCDIRCRVRSRLDDRMDSYFLAETTKYLFMLFDHALVPSGHTELYVRTGAAPWRACLTCRMPVGISQARQHDRVVSWDDDGTRSGCRHAE